MTITPSLGLTTTSQAAGSAVTFLDWRLAVNGTTTSNMLIIDAYSGSSGSVVLNTGKSGSQTIPGGNTASGSLFLQSTTDATKGKIFLGANSAYDESGSRLGIGIANPTQSIETNGNIKCGSSGSTNYIYFTTGSVNNPGVRYNNSGSSIEIAHDGINWYKPREVLTAARTYYVSTTGSDTNTGLGSGSAFATIQKAVNTVASLDLSIYDVTIQISGGSYISDRVTLKNCVGSGAVYILGDSVTPENVLIHSTGANAANFYIDTVGTVYHLRHFKLSAAGASATAIWAQYGSVVKIQNLVFGSGFSNQMVSFGGFIQQIGSTNYKIVGGASTHISAQAGGFFQSTGATITNDSGGVVNWTKAFVEATDASIVRLFTSTASGSFTGSYYTLSTNSILSGSAQAAKFGNSAGTTSTGGQAI